MGVRMGSSLPLPSSRISFTWCWKALSTGTSLFPCLHLGYFTLNRDMPHLRTFSSDQADRSWDQGDRDPGTSTQRGLAKVWAQMPGQTPWYQPRNQDGRSVGSQAFPSIPEGRAKVSGHTGTCLRTAGVCREDTRGPGAAPTSSTLKRIQVAPALQSRGILQGPLPSSSVTMQAPTSSAQHPAEPTQAWEVRQ